MYGMSDYQLNEYLEVIAKLIGLSAQTPDDAVKIVRGAKIAGAVIESDSGNMSDEQYQAIEKMHLQICLELISKSDSLEEAETMIRKTFFSDEEDREDEEEVALLAQSIVKIIYETMKDSAEKNDLLQKIKAVFYDE